MQNQQVIIKNKDVKNYQAVELVADQGKLR
jgi:hypothetical protein